MAHSLALIIFRYYKAPLYQDLSIHLSVHWTWISPDGGRAGGAAASVSDGIDKGFGNERCPGVAGDRGIEVIGAVSIWGSTDAFDAAGDDKNADGDDRNGNTKEDGIDKEGAGADEAGKDDVTQPKMKLTWMMPM